MTAEWPYPQRRRFAGVEVGCLLCPTMVQREIGADNPGLTPDALLRLGLIRHLEVVHGLKPGPERKRIADDTLRNRPRRHDEQRTN